MIGDGWVEFKVGCDLAVSDQLLVRERVARSHVVGVGGDWAEVIDVHLSGGHVTREDVGFRGHAAHVGGAWCVGHDVMEAERLAASGLESVGRQ